MTDPERLSKDSAHSLTALLLQAGAQEKPSAAVLSRITSAVAITATAATAAAVVKSAGSASAATAGAASSASATLGAAAVAKWIAIGALGGAVAMSSLHALSGDRAPRSQRPSTAAIANAARAKPDPQATKVALRAPEPVASAQPIALERANVVEAAKPRAVEPAPSESTQSVVPEHTKSALLAAEVRFVDQGRAALQRGAFAEAIAQLEPYERVFPRQQLLTEVLFLRMESCRRLGNAERAKTLAAHLLALGAVGRQAAQAREVLGP